MVAMVDAGCLAAVRSCPLCGSGTGPKRAGDCYIHVPAGCHVTADGYPRIYGHGPRYDRNFRSGVDQDVYGHSPWLRDGHSNTTSAGLGYHDVNCKREVDWHRHANHGHDCRGHVYADRDCDVDRDCDADRDCDSDQDCDSDRDASAPARGGADGASQSPRCLRTLAIHVDGGRL